MPIIKFQKIVFALIMSYSMAYGIELYNIAIKMGYHSYADGFSNMGMDVFPAALMETPYMGILVSYSQIYGKRIGAYSSQKQFGLEKHSPYARRLSRQINTVGIMCPTMSFAASVLSSTVIGGESLLKLPAIWFGTIIKTFPWRFSGTYMWQLPILIGFLIFYSRTTGID